MRYSNTPASAVGFRKSNREPISYNNNKPFRTKVQKQEAKDTAYKAKNGTWRSNAPVSYHTAHKGA